MSFSFPAPKTTVQNEMLIRINCNVFEELNNFDDDIVSCSNPSRGCDGLQLHPIPFQRVVVAVVFWREIVLYSL